MQKTLFLFTALLTVAFSSVMSTLSFTKKFAPPYDIVLGIVQIILGVALLIQGILLFKITLRQRKAKQKPEIQNVK